MNARTVPEALARLIDESAVRAIIARYPCAVDWMNWPVVESLFWPDAHIDFGELFRGDRAAFLPFVKALEEGYTRRLHSFGEPRIVLAGDEAQVEATAVMHVRSLAAGARTDVVVYGRYLFGLARRAQEWRLASLTFYFNHLVAATTTESDAGPMNPADGLDMRHPRAPQF